MTKTKNLKVKEAASHKKASDGDNTDLFEYGLMNHKGKMAMTEAGRQENAKHLTKQMSGTPIISVQVDSLFP